MTATPLLAPLAGLLAVAAPTLAQQNCGTTVPAGTVTGQTWTLAGSPYCVAGDLQVDALTVEAGVLVLVDGPYRIDVLSTITVEGTCREPVTFAPRIATTPWKGFHFEATGPGSTFRHAIVTGSDTSAFTLIDCAGPLFEDCTLYDNRNVSGFPTQGGAIHAAGLTSDLVLERCSFVGNKAQNGGALWASLQPGASLVVVDSTFDDNLAESTSTWIPIGGAVHVTTGDVLIQGSTFRGNRSSFLVLFDFTGQAKGGACAFTGAGVRTIEGSHFVGNRAFVPFLGLNCLLAEAHGGAVYAIAGSLDVANTVFAGNRLDASGCDISRTSGSALLVGNAQALVTNCTLVRNVNGPAIGQEPFQTPFVQLRNSIAYFNNGGGTQLQAVASASYCCVQNGIAGTGNLTADPLFLGAGNNVEDLVLDEASPCIDAGDPAPALEDGCAPPGQGGARNDMGAFGGPGNCDWGCAVSARAVARNGSGVNDEILRNLRAPVPGRCWMVQLDCTGSTPSVGYLQVKRFPTSGVFMLGQEVLIAGPQFLAQQKMHAGDALRFTGPVPSAVVLCGFTASVQGACFGGGFRLSNALDLTLGR